MTPANAGELLSRRAAGANAPTVAMIDGRRRITYSDLLRRAESLSVSLQDRGVRKGDRVVIFLQRSVEAAVALFGTWFAGGVAVIANERLRSQQLHHVIEHSEASCVVTDDRQLLAVPLLPCEHVINLDREAPRDGRPHVFLGGADLAMLVYTSGSTGLPKGIMLSHDNLLAGTRIVAGYLNLTEHDVILSVLPFSFDYGLNQLLTVVEQGATIVLFGFRFGE